MSRAQLIRSIAALFAETAQAHQRAYEKTDGFDPDWAIWYAKYIASRITALIRHELSCSDLVRVILDAEDEHRARDPEAEWSDYYARHFVERCVGVESAETLALYYYPSCPFCRMVIRAIDELKLAERGIDIELRDIQQNSAYRAELVAARGRATVPVLRCTTAEYDRWMPESRDVIAYLRRRFA